MNETQNLKLPVMCDAELKRYHMYQVARIRNTQKTGWCLNMLPIALSLRELAENEMDLRNIHHLKSKRHA